MTSPNELGTVTTRVVSPCEHGITHHISELADGDVQFAVPECVDSKGNPRPHAVTPAKYPETRRRR